MQRGDDAAILGLNHLLLARDLHLADRNGAGAQGSVGRPAPETTKKSEQNDKSDGYHGPPIFRRVGGQLNIGGRRRGNRRGVLGGHDRLFMRHLRSPRLRRPDRGRD